jgi:hypothetical protein
MSMMTDYVYDIRAFVYDKCFLCPQCGSRNKKKPPDSKKCVNCGISWRICEKNWIEVFYGGDKNDV